MILGVNVLQWLLDRLTEASASLGAVIGPLLGLVSHTRLDWTTQNPIVLQGWAILVGAADSLLGLIVMVGIIRIMYSQSTGALSLPVGQFVGRALLTVLFIHLSAFFAEQLLRINNGLCALVQINLAVFLVQVNNGQLLDARRAIVLTIALLLIFGFTLIRIVFQAVKRLIRFIVLFVLSGPAFATSFHPATATIFAIWLRMLIATIFEQFLQVLTFGLGFQFFITIHQTGLTAFVLAMALLSLTAEVPGLLARFSAQAGTSGLGGLIGTAMRVGVLLS